MADRKDGLKEYELGYKRSLIYYLKVVLNVIIVFLKLLSKLLKKYNFF